MYRAYTGYLNKKLYGNDVLGRKFALKSDLFEDWGFESLLSHKRNCRIVGFVRRTENPKAEVRFLAVPQTKMMIVEFFKFCV